MKPENKTRGRGKVVELTDSIDGASSFGNQFIREETKVLEGIEPTDVTAHLGQHLLLQVVVEHVAIGDPAQGADELTLLINQ